MDGNILKYQAFVKAVEYGSFTRAAEVLSYSQSSVSKMIADLEQEWGIQVLVRSKGGVELTVEGQDLLAYARELLDSFQRMEDRVNQLNGLSAGLLRIATISSVATYWLPDLIRGFQQDYPNIEYELLTGDHLQVEQWIAEGRVECGFMNKPSKTELDYFSLKKDEVVAVLPLDHPLAQKKTIDPEDLNGLSFMLLEQGGKTEAAEFLDRYNVHPEIRFTTLDDYAIAAMVEAGLGVSVLSRLILKRMPFRIMIRSFTKPFYRELVMGMRDDSRLTVAARAFINYVSEHFKMRDDNE